MPADRTALAQAFLDRSGWGTARQNHLAGDASARSYQRLTGPSGQSAVLMDAPPGKGEDVGPFIRVAGHLAGLGLSPPRIFAADEANGFLLLEDLGDDLYARVIPGNATLELPLYSSAVDVLTILQSHPPAPDLPVYDAATMAAAVAPAVDWYRFAITGEKADPRPLCDETGALLTCLADAPPVMILRDYHAENLLWLPDRAGAARVGLLDFQMAMLSHPAVDLVSLVQDARRDVSPAVEDAMIRRFVAETGRDEGPFRAACAIIGAQRHLRILGIFARLSLHFGKPGYVAFIPRVWASLQQDLAHPELATLARIVSDLLPGPSAEALQRIRDKCGTVQTP